MARSAKKKLACAVVIAVLLRQRRRRRRNRKQWTRKWIQNRESQGAFHQLLQELRVLDVSSYMNFVRMDAATFEELLQMVAPLITYQDTTMREAIPSAERLAVTLRFLATGELYSFSVSMQYKSCMMMMMTQTILHYRWILHKSPVSLLDRCTNHWKHYSRYLQSYHWSAAWIHTGQQEILVLAT